MHWLGGPVSAATGWVSVWLITNIPGLQIFGSTDTIAKAITTAVVFGVTAGLTWLSHDKVFQWIIEKIESAINPPTPPAPPAKFSTLIPTDSSTV